MDDIQITTSGDGRDRVLPSFFRRPGKALALAAVIAALAMATCAWKPKTAAKPVRARHGMVASAHPLASEAGRDILERGGNAVDAAVAAAFVLSVVEPYSSGIGGGGFMLVYPGEGAEAEVIDYREVAPAKATRDMYQRGGKLVPGLSSEGPLAVGVPGTVAGLADALERHGTMPLAEVMAPAIALARDGFTADSHFHQRILLGMAVFDECAADVFLNRGAPYLPGQRIRQPDLARTLELIAGQGPDVFYKGEIASAIAKDLAEKGGIMTEADLASYKPRIREPVTGSYRGYQVVSMPPPSSGGAVVIQVLNVLEHYDLASMGYGSPETVHVMAEAMKLAFADRAVFMGDPAFVDAPIDTLTSKTYADKQASMIKTGSVIDSLGVVPGAGMAEPPEGWKGLAEKGAAPGEGMHTTHLSVVDKNGMAVSLTQTVNTNFGSGVVACGTGIVMNNEMDDFAAMPGEPNAFGLIQGEANSVAPGKIPLSSMSPTMVFKDGRLFMVVGSPGGPRIITTVIQSVVNVIDFEMDIQEAVTAPRVHHQWMPDQVLIEKGRLSPAMKAELKRKGHKVKNYIMPCNAQGVVVLPGGGLEGGSDPRGVGEPRGH